MVEFRAAPRAHRHMICASYWLDLTDDIRLPFWEKSVSFEPRADRVSPCIVGLQPTVIASRAPHLLLEQSVMIEESWTCIARQHLVRRAHPPAILNRFASNANGGSGNVRQRSRVSLLRPFSLIGCNLHCEATNPAA